jgi:hypothetical protein
MNGFLIVNGFLILGIRTKTIVIRTKKIRKSSKYENKYESPLTKFLRHSSIRLRHSFNNNSSRSNHWAQDDRFQAQALTREQMESLGLSASLDATPGEQHDPLALSQHDPLALSQSTVGGGADGERLVDYYGKGGGNKGKASGKGGMFKGGKDGNSFSEVFSPEYSYNGGKDGARDGGWKDGGKGGKDGGKGGKDGGWKDMKGGKGFYDDGVSPRGFQSRSPGGVEELSLDRSARSHQSFQHSMDGLSRSQQSFQGKG